MLDTARELQLDWKTVKEVDKEYMRAVKNTLLPLTDLVR